MSTATAQSLNSRLIDVQQRLKAPKDLNNSFGNYKYRSAESILESVKPLLTENGLVLTITDEIVSVGDRVYVKATAKVMTENESHCVSAYAREEESKKGMDTAQITGSTSSYARKYALNGLFLIDDTKDPDSQDNTKHVSKFTPSQTRLASDKQKEFIVNLLRQHGIEIGAMPEYLTEHYGILPGQPMSQADAQMIIDDLNSGGER